MRFSEPPDVEAGLMLAIAVGGLLINLVAARILYGHAGESLNVSAAFRHVIADILGSVGVIVAALVILATGWEYADPVVSVAIGILILASSWTILRDSVQVLLEGSPPGTDVQEVGTAMASVPGVRQIHDLHVWTITSGFPALAAHVLVDRDTDCHATRRRLEAMLTSASGSNTRPCRSTTRVASCFRSRHEDRAGRLRDRRRSLADRPRRGLGLPARGVLVAERPRDVVERSIEGSLALGLYAPGDEQAGFARAVTDGATYAWIADVFVLEAHRGRGLGVWLVETLFAHPRLQGLRIVTLNTLDAHSLYERFGFVRDGERRMVRQVSPAELYGSPGEKLTE